MADKKLINFTDIGSLLATDVTAIARPANTTDFNASMTEVATYVLSVIIPSAGIAYSNGTAFVDATISTGLTLAAGGTLSIAPATTLALGGIIAGSGTTINAGGTLTVAASTGTDANVTATGTNQAGAYAITKATTIFDTVAASSGGVLPAWAANAAYQVLNRGGATLSIYPATGAQIEALGTNAAASVVAGGGAQFTADTTGLWRAS